VLYDGSGVEKGHKARRGIRERTRDWLLFFIGGCERVTRSLCSHTDWKRGFACKSLSKLDNDEGDCLVCGLGYYKGI
jgi:hypothetical protein